MTGSMKTESDDARARERIRGSLDESLIVEAAAGTGKTSELVHRIVAVLGSGRTRVDRIVAVTFTRKAAGELKLRLRQELDQARNNAQENRRNWPRSNRRWCVWKRAHIGTIHSFCADILHERPVEASIQPGFEELDEKQAPRLFARAFSKWIQERLSNPPPGLRRALSRAASWAPNRSPLGQIENAAWRLVEWRDFPRPWRREEFSREEEIDALVDQVVELSTMVSSSRNFRDPLRQALRRTIDFRTRVERAEAVRKRDYDDLEAVLVRLGRDLKWNRKKGRGKFSDDCSRQQVLDRREQLLERLNGFQIRAEADLASLLRDELWGLVERYDEAKTRAGKVDFVDLLLATRNLIRDDGDVRGFLQGRFTHIFVDEFQDTDPLQAEILLLLASDNPREADWLQTTPVPGKLFLVGDPKAVDLPVPARRRRLVSVAPREADIARSRTAVPDEEFSGRARHPEGRECRVRHSHGRRSDNWTTLLCPARPAFRAHRRPAVGHRASGRTSLRLVSGNEKSRGRRPARHSGRLHRMASERKRVAGPESGTNPGRRFRYRPGMSASCSAGFYRGERTSPAATSTPWRPATSPTCSGEPSRSTSGRRSRRSGLR